jgi:hypothetical protein
MGKYSSRPEHGLGVLVYVTFKPHFLKWVHYIDFHKQKQKHFYCARAKKGLEVEQIQVLAWLNPPCLFVLRSKPCGAGVVMPFRTPLIDAA